MLGALVMVLVQAGGATLALGDRLASPASLLLQQPGKAISLQPSKHPKLVPLSYESPLLSIVEAISAVCAVKGGGTVAALLLLIAGAC